MPQKTHTMHGRDHLSGGADPIPGLCETCIPGAGTPILDHPCLVAFWKLNETSGDVAVDSGPDGYDLDSGSLAPPTWGQPAGPPGETSAGFDTGQGESLSSFPALTGDFTLEIWAYRTQTVNGDFLIGQGDPSDADNQGVALFIENASTGTHNKLAVHIGDTSGGPHAVEGDTALAIDTWYHCAVVRASNIWTLYLDGVPQSSTYDDSGTNYASDTGIWIGSNTAQHSEGNLSYAAVYDCALDVGTIDEHFQADPAVQDGEVLTSDGAGGVEWRLATVLVNY